MEAGGGRGCVYGWGGLRDERRDNFRGGLEWRRETDEVRRSNGMIWSRDIE